MRCFFLKSSVAWIDDVHLIHLVLPEELSGKNDSSPSLVRKMTGEVFPLTIEKFLNEQTVQLYIEQELPMGEELYMNWNNFRIPVFPRNIVRTAWFEEHYTPTDCELGAICHEDATTFTLWAPTATSVYLVLDGTRFLMSRQEKGIWSITIHGDWHGKTYEYEVDVCGKKNSVIDPYAKSSLANTKTGVVINLKKTEQIKGPRPKIDNLQDAIIYELHIRDMTIDKESGIKHRGKYLGLTEENTTTKNGFSTGLSYIKELGVTHVELLPINDFARVNESDPSDSYNWGYDRYYIKPLKAVMRVQTILLQELTNVRR